VVARTGSQWRYLPDHYGKWNSVFRRYRRWIESGIFDAMLETLAELAGQDRQTHMVDSTVIRAHHCAVGVKKGLTIKMGSAARAAASRPKSRHAMARDAPIGFVLTPGQTHGQEHTDLTLVRCLIFCCLSGVRAGEPLRLRW
jgi:transposase